VDLWNEELSDAYFQGGHHARDIEGSDSDGGNVDEIMRETDIESAQPPAPDELHLPAHFPSIGSRPERDGPRRSLMNDPDGPGREGGDDVGRDGDSRSLRHSGESLAHLRTAFRSVVLLTLLTGVMFPVVLAALARLLFHHQVGGSLIIRGRVLGSELI